MYPPPLAWTASCEVPYDGGFTKNRIYRNAGRGMRVMTRAAKARRAEVATAVRLSLGRKEVEQAKLWVVIDVGKTEHVTDCVNVLDLVCDAIEDATGLDDRWYSVVADWSRRSEDAAMRVTIGQEKRPASRACAKCEGSFPTIDGFPRYPSGPYGRNWNCRECCAEAKRRAR